MIHQWRMDKHSYISYSFMFKSQVWLRRLKFVNDSALNYEKYSVTTRHMFGIGRGMSSYECSLLETICCTFSQPSCIWKMIYYAKNAKECRFRWRWWSFFVGFWNIEQKKWRFDVVQLFFSRKKTRYDSLDVDLDVDFDLFCHLKKRWTPERGKKTEKRATK